MERIEQQILRKLKSKEENPWSLILYQDGRGLDYGKSIHKLLKQGIIKFTKRGLKLAKKISFNPLPSICGSCGGKGITLEGYEREFEQFKKEFKAMQKVLKMEANYDQSGMYPKDTFLRLLFADLHGDIYSKRIICFGDDDLASVAAAILGTPKSITVVDIDKRLIDYIRKRLRTYGCDFQAVIYDVRNELPSNLKRAHDTFITEPLDNLEPLKIWLSRCFESLSGKDCAGYFGISQLEISPEQLFEVQKVLFSMNVVITDIIRRFNVYPWKNNVELYREYFLIHKVMNAWNVYFEPKKDFYTSNLFRCECITKPKPIVQGKVEILDFYKDEEKEAQI